MFHTANIQKRPSFFWLATEPSRALTELGMSYSYNAIFKAEKKGDGHPVMILPGFMSTKVSTSVLRNHLTKLGYQVHDWGMGRNLGKVEYMPIVIEMLEVIYQKTGHPISLIGWSLGGIFARQLAKERPDLIRQVITLGSPFADVTHPNNVEWIYSMISGGKTAKDLNKDLLENLPLPAPVPTTAIYSKEDGVVPWRACLELQEDALHQNIQVRGSHIGMGVNPTVLAIITDRLTYHRNNWQHFKPKGLVDNLLFYPSL
jgi:alpha/beta superfamily hydrolase